MHGITRIEYRSTRQLAGCLIGCLAMGALFASAGVWAHVLTLDTSEPIVGGAAMLFLQVALVAATLVVWCAWVYRTNRNAHALDVNGDMHFSPVMAMAWQVIPVVNVVKARQVMVELWMASEPDSSKRWQDSSQMIPAWWGALLGAAIFGFMGNQMQQRSTIGAEQVAATWLSIGSGVLLVIAAGAAIVIVRDIGKRQMVLYTRHRASDMVSGRAVRERPVMSTHVIDAA